MTPSAYRNATLAWLGLLALPAAPALAAPTDLSAWTAEGGGTWNVAGDNNSVTQTINGTPTVFYSDFDGQGVSLSGTIRVGADGDDDFIGFVLGFEPGDLTAASTDFIVVDWKQSNQGGFFGCTALAGLSISRASAGLGDNSGAWCHSGNGVTELARASTLGSTGWVDNTTYLFDLQFTAGNIKVFVDNVLQLDVNGTFADGRFGFYNYSQSSVVYSAIEQDILPPPPNPIPEPATWAMLISGFGLVGGAMRVRARRSKIISA